MKRLLARLSFAPEAVADPLNGGFEELDQRALDSDYRESFTLIRAVVLQYLDRFQISQ